MSTTGADNSTSCSIGILSTLKGWMMLLKNRQNRRSVSLE